MTYDEDDWYERQELAAEDRAERRYRARLPAHPDCRDPEHPGCPQCESDEDEYQPDEEDEDAHP